MNIYNFNVHLENPGIDPGTSRMLSERSTIWAKFELAYYGVADQQVSHYTMGTFPK